MRTRLALVTGFFFVSLAAYGCGSDDSSGGDDQQAPIPAPGGKDGKDGQPGAPGTPGSPGGSTTQPGSPSAPSTGGPPPAGTGTPPAGTGTPPAGTGTPPVTPPGGGSSGAIPEAKCVGSSLKEAEGNNDLNAANAITLDSAQTFCGSLTAADADHFSFVLPADAKEFGYKSSWTGFGTPTVSVIVEGVTYGANDKMPFKPGAKYVFKIADAAQPVDYVIALGVKR